jgi:hypothetical protein
MPGGDRTGPMGMGPVSGRGAGYCAGYDAPGFAQPAGGRGFGRGRGRGFRGGGFGGGRGWRNRFWATGLTGWQRAGAQAPIDPAPHDNRQALQAQAAALREELEAINRRLDQMGGSDEQTRG